jgi:hypothetical protein
MYKKLIKEKFIEGGIKNEDPWLTSIGHALLKEYVKCVNCLYHFSNKSKDILMLSNNLKQEKQLENWKNNYYPTLSNFHPSLFILAERL